MPKVVLATVGLLIFATGMRLDSEPVRWAGIALVLVAWLLRFAGPRPGA